MKDDAQRTVIRAGDGVPAAPPVDGGGVVAQPDPAPAQPAGKPSTAPWPGPEGSTHTIMPNGDLVYTRPGEVSRVLAKDGLYTVTFANGQTLTHQFTLPAGGILEYGVMYDAQGKPLFHDVPGVTWRSSMGGPPFVAQEFFTGESVMVVVGDENQSAVIFHANGIKEEVAQYGRADSARVLTLPARTIMDGTSERSVAPITITLAEGVQVSPGVDGQSVTYTVGSSSATFSKDGVIYATANGTPFGEQHDGLISVWQPTGQKASYQVYEDEGMLGTTWSLEMDGSCAVAVSYGSKQRGHTHTVSQFSNGIQQFENHLDGALTRRWPDGLELSRESGGNEIVVYHKVQAEWTTEGVYTVTFPNGTVVSHQVGSVPVVGGPMLRRDDHGEVIVRVYLGRGQDADQTFSDDTVTLDLGRGGKIIFKSDGSKVIIGPDGVARRDM